MREEFDEILRLLDFENRAYEIFRRWYVDGRLFYHKVIDPQNPSGGLAEFVISTLAKFVRSLNTNRRDPNNYAVLI